MATKQPGAAGAGAAAGGGGGGGGAAAANSRPTLHVDTRAIAANYGLLKQRCAGAACGATIKAGLYGLEAYQALPLLSRQGCRDFFVATTQEAKTCRAHLGLENGANLYVLNGYEPDSQGAAFPVISTPESFGAAAQVHALQVDIGMGRFGLSPEDLPQLEVAKIANGCLIIGHLSEAEVQGSAVTSQQIALFRRLVGQIKDRLPSSIGVRTSLANSSGLFVPDAQSDCARPGYGLYGGNPTPGQANPMAPVVTLFAPIVQVRRLTAGQGVGYGTTWRAPANGWIATISVGYADGWFRRSSNQAMARYRGRLVPLVGTISMDSMMLFTAQNEPCVGEPVHLIDDCGGLCIDAVAARAQTIGYEVLTGLGSRFTRRYV